MDYYAIDSTIIKISIPLVLLLALYLVIRNINNTYTSGTLFIDYFKIRKLDVVFSFIFVYMMLVFLALTIIFSYNQLYINNKTCNPLMLYLGSKQWCMRTNFENFENKTDLDNETILEKLAFLFEIVKSPLLRLYSITLAILKSIYKFIIYIHLQFVVYMTYFFIKQDEICDKIKGVFIEPLLIRVTDPLFKIIQMGLNKITDR